MYELYYTCETFSCLFRGDGALKCYSETDEDWVSGSRCQNLPECDFFFKILCVAEIGKVA